MPEQSLVEYMEQEFMEGRIITLSGDVKTADKAAQRLGIDKEQIIKSLVFLVDGEPYLVIVQGTERADTEKIKDVMEAETVEIAERSDVKELTGYAVGGVPPVNVPLRKIIDETILEYDLVYGGGGATNKNLEINPRCIVDEDSIVADIT